MVLFKRKTVVIPPPKYTPEHADQEVWFIPETLEYFCTYDEYLARLDFYSKKKFICELSGASCLTYFDARQREIKETENVLKRFPAPLKRPILEKVHMETITRLDQLVDELYAWLKDRFFVGELVTVGFLDQRVKAEVIKAENGVYQVDDGRHILEGDASQLVRDRKIVSKLTLRAFVKHSASREQWVGAPWIVRQDYVEKFNLPTEMPPEVKRLYKQRAEEAAQSHSNVTSAVGSGDGDTASSGGKAASAFDDDEYDANIDELDGGDHASAPASSSGSKHGSQRLSRKRIIRILENLAETGNHFKNDDLFQLARNAADEPLSEYIANLKSANPWPEWHTDTRLAELEAVGKIGHLFEIWLFSRFFHDLLHLKESSILTFDEFVDALSSHDVPEPIVDLHEAVFNLLVPEGATELSMSLPAQAEEDHPKRKKRGGRPPKRAKINGADNEDDDNDDNMDDDDVEDEGAEDDDQEGKDSKAETSSINDSGDESVDKNNSDVESHSDDGSSDDDDDGETKIVETWAERIGKRDYADGGWQMLLAEILSDLCYLREWHPDTRAVVDILSPPDQLPTPVSAASAYADMQLGHRVHALMMIIRILYGSPQLRDYLDSRYDQLTKLRKRPLTRELRQLHDDLRTVERVIALAEQKDSAASENAGKIEEIASTYSADDNSSLDNKSKPTENGKEKTEGEEIQDLESLKKIHANILEQYNKKSEEANDVSQRIAKLDNQRMRLLGRDRFFNRYWWMDGNCLSGPTENYYAMGKLCVQGPSTEDLAECLNSEIYADEFVSYRKKMFVEAQKLKQQHKMQLKMRREAKLEAERRVSSAPSTRTISNISSPASDSGVGPMSSCDPERIEHRLRELLEIHRVMHGLTEEETIELRQLQMEAAKANIHVDINSSEPQNTGSTKSLSESSRGGRNSSKQHQSKQHNDAKDRDEGKHNVSTSPPAEDLKTPTMRVIPKAGETPEDGDSTGDATMSDQKLTEQQMRLKQAQNQVQLQAQIAARVQAHFDAEVEAQANARTQQIPTDSPQPVTQQQQQQPQQETDPSRQPPQQPQQLQHIPVQAQGSQVPAIQQAGHQPQQQYAPAASTQVQAPVVPPVTYASQQQQQQLPQQSYVYPQQQDQVQWVIQQTAYGPMLYAVPVQQYQVLVQHYGLQQPPLQANGMPTADAYQAYLQQLAMQQSYMNQGYQFAPPGYPQPQMYGPQVVGIPGQQPPPPQMQVMATPVAPSQPQLVNPPPAAQPAVLTQQAQPTTVAQPPSVENPVTNVSMTEASPAPMPATKGTDDNSQALSVVGQSSQAGEQVSERMPQSSDEALRNPPNKSAKTSSYLSQVMNPTENQSVAENQNHVPTSESHVKVDMEQIAAAHSTKEPTSREDSKLESVSKTGLNDVDAHTDSKLQIKKTEETKSGKVPASFPFVKEEIQSHPSNREKKQKDRKKLTESHERELKDFDEEPVISPLDLLDSFENKLGLLSPNEWRFYETPDEVQSLISYLLDFGSREAKLLDSMRKLEETMKQTMELRLKSLSIKDEDLHSSAKNS